MVDRVASFSHTSQLIDNNLRIQAEYAEKQVQTATGLVSDTYDGISSDASTILNLESEYAQLLSQSDNAETALNRSEMTYSALSSVTDVGQSFLADLTSAVSGISIDEDEIQTIATTVLDQIVSTLNTQVAGRYLFSGSAITTAPVDVSSYGGATIPSAADTSYYQGNDYTNSVEAADGYTVDYGLNADDAALEQIIRALDLVMTTPDDSDTLIEALSLLESGLDDLAVTQAQVAQGSAALDQAIDENLEEMNLIDNMITELKEVDLAEVSVRLTELETQLEASYSVTTTLLNLNITDFI